MTGRDATGAVLAVVLVAALAASACGDKKDPLVPDNPNSDPMMMDGGAGAVDPSLAAPAASSAPK